jgi:hypothetical protein
MVSSPAANQIRRRMLLTAFVLVLIAAVLLPLAKWPAAAQNKKFTATPLTPSGTVLVAKKGKATRPANRPAVLPPVRPAVLSGICDVSIAPGSTPGGYQPLSGFSTTPFTASDDSVTNFTVPPYTFAGETYTQIGMSSNGYAIIGGTTDAGDNTTVNQNFPDPTLPNNVLAPFWTDLNPETGGTLYTDVLTDGSDSWIVLDWEAVTEFSTLNQNSFEIWIGINGDAHPGEDVSYAYGTIQGSGNGGFLTVGAENKSGTHGQNYYVNGTGTLPTTGAQLRVTTTSCVVQRPWSTTGSSGAIDEDSALNADVHNFVVAFKPGATGTVTSRYNITSTAGLSGFCPATSSHFAVRFRDSDAAGTGGRILVTLHRSDISGGGNTILYTFDSNVSAQAVGSAFQSYSADIPVDFDFGTKIYWLEAQLTKSDPSVFVDLGTMQLYESEGTACP